MFTIEGLDKSVRQVYDKRRWLDKVVIKEVEKESCVEEDVEQERICLFSDEDKAKLRKYGYEMIHKKKARFSKNYQRLLDGTGLLETYKISQLRTRVQYERRKNKKGSEIL